jgi:hypothetical protein
MNGHIPDAHDCNVHKLAIWKVIVRKMAASGVLIALMFAANAWLGGAREKLVHDPMVSLSFGTVYDAVLLGAILLGLTVALGRVLFVGWHGEEQKDTGSPRGLVE